MHPLLHTRAEAPIPGEAWPVLESVVQETARRRLVGRRVLPVYGPLGPSVSVLPGAVTTGAPLPLLTLQADFTWDWQSLAWIQTAAPVWDTAPVAGAARQVAAREDRLIFQGAPEHGIAGLLTAPGHTERTLERWQDPEPVLDTVLEAAAQLAERGYPGPYALVADPGTVAYWHRRWGMPGDSVARALREALGHPIEASSAVPPGTAVLVPLQEPGLDVVVGMDWTVGWVETADLVARFRVLETVVPRLRAPEAIVVIRRLAGASDRGG